MIGDVNYYYWVNLCIYSYLKFTVDQYVESDYTVLYLHYGLTAQNKPSFSWLRQMYKDLDRKWDWSI